MKRLMKELRNYGIHVETGEFGADMKVELMNDSPVTICIEYKNKGIMTVEEDNRNKWIPG